MEINDKDWYDSGWLSKVTFDQAESEILNAIYKASHLFERLEDAGRVRANGHHVQQRLAAVAADMLEDIWDDETYSLRKHLLSVKGAVPKCKQCDNTDTTLNNSQFLCPVCGWSTAFSQNFISKYKKAQKPNEYQEEVKRLQKIIEEVSLYFTSGNAIPVERATILTKDFVRILNGQDKS